MKSAFCLAATAAILLCLVPAQAQTLRSASPDARFDTLRPESGFQDWRRLSLEGGARPTDVGAGYAYTLPGDPLGANSAEMIGGYWRPLSQRLSSLVETSVIPGAGGTGERSVLGQLATQFGKGWGLQAGVRRSDLGVPLSEPANGAGGLGLSALPPMSGTSSMGADLGIVTVERFWDRYRGAYTLSSGRADGGATATSHRLQFSYFYSARSSVGLSYTTGRVFDPALPLSGLTGMTPVETSNYGVMGEHWFTPSWSINYNALLEDHGVDGLRPEIRLGLRLRF
ncbi:MAG TPA: hypothetical protein VML56_13245 [Burkholderiales bacterium]|nr:hypothetical protein [Burkholderiales bacterium]